MQKRKWQAAPCVGFCLLPSAFFLQPLKWSPRLVSRQRLLGFSEALICLSYSGKWLAKPKLGERRLGVPAGNAPASSGYQPGALLLSYRTMAEGVGNAPTSARADPVFETGAASLYLPAFRERIRVSRFALASSSFRTCGRVLYTTTKDPPREGTRPTGICR